MQVAVLTILPGLLYLSLFSLHFSLLTKVGVMLVTLIVTFLALFHGSYYQRLYDCDADTDSNHPQAGTHDALMTSQFQASLEGGLGSIIR